MDNQADRPQIVAFNLLVLVVAGVAFSFWMLRYTDWFPVVGGLMGLTGGFAWLAFLAKIVPESRKQALQQWLDAKILRSALPGVLLILCAATFLLGFTSWHGTLVLDTLGDAVARTVEIRCLDCDGAEIERLGSQARDERRVLLPTRFLGPATYRVKLDGLPARDFQIRPWDEQFVLVPADLLSASVALLRPTPVMSGEASQGEFALVVRVDGQEYGRISAYKGGAVWIGAEADVEIPARLVDRWRLEFISQKVSPALVTRWVLPGAIIGEARLRDGARIVATIEREGAGAEGIQGRVETELRAPKNSAQFPQEIVIDVISN